MQEVQVITREKLPKHKQGHSRVRARAFFGQALPLVLLTTSAELPPVSIGFDVVGWLGGRWTVHIDKRRVVPRLEQADVVIKMSVGSFEGMLRGAVDVRAALRLGTIQVTGDRSALSALGALLGGEQ